MPRKKSPEGSPPPAKSAPAAGSRRKTKSPSLTDVEMEALAQAKRTMTKPKSRKPKATPKDPADVDDDISEEPPPKKKPKKPARKKAGKGAAWAWPEWAKMPSLPSFTLSAKKGSRPPENWRQWVLLEVLTVVGGLVVGLGLTGGLVWVRAERDVAAFLADPPRANPSVVWSAPMEIRPGMRVSVPAITGDLLAAGFERVDQVAESEGTGTFAVTGQGIELWSAPWRGPTGESKGGKASIRIEEGVVTKTTPRQGIVLRPTVLGTLGDLEGKRESVTLTELSEWVEPALLSMEDSRFRTHHGIDPIGVLRALAMTMLYDDVQGGSTLTQQLAKNLFLTKERTVRRKVREIFFAAALEQQLDKDELLALYLSEVYLGQMGGLPLYGVDAAARAWFGVSAASLELHQAATIVGAIPAPNRWSPVRHPQAAIDRRNVVLARMLEVGEIDEAQHKAALAMPMELVGLEPSRIRRAPYAVDTVVDRAEEILGEGVLASRGYAVYTGIQPVLQRAAEEAVAQGMAELDTEFPKAAGAEVALVAVRIEDGTVVALVGGRSYAKSPYNRAEHAQRQVGSTVKPLTMLAAFDQGSASPATVLDDSPIVRNAGGVSWTPKNYDGKFVGEVSVREAIEGSRNIPAILLAEGIGHTKLQRVLKDAGLSHATALPSAALGSFSATPMELAGAYTAFGRGTAYEPRVLLAITDAEGEELLTVKPTGHPIASEQAAALAVDVLQGVITKGTAARASKYGVGPPAVGKTGTTDDYRDAWFVGLTPELVVAVWVGQDEGTLGLAGSRAALPTWARFVVASGTLKGSHPRPDGLVQIEVCPESGLPARDICPETYAEWFIEELVPEEKCDDHGGPIIRTGRLFDRLFGGRRGRETPAGTEGAEGEPADTPRPRDRRKRRED
jgi:penicillin-binding protein 1B